MDKPPGTSLAWHTDVGSCPGKDRLRLFVLQLLPLALQLPWVLPILRLFPMLMLVLLLALLLLLLNLRPPLTLMLLALWSPLHVPRRWRPLLWCR